MKIAMIGSGGIARRHLDVLRAEPDITVVGHVAPTLAHAAAAAQRWGGTAYTTTDELLAHEDVDVAWVCVTPDAHGSIEQALIARGIPFFIEKPLAADLATAEELAAQIVRHTLVVGVGYHWRALDTIAEVQATLATRPARLVIGAWHDATPSPRWWRHQATSGGQVVEQATHLFDLARCITGEAEVVAARASRPPHPIYPDADVAGASATLLQFAGGATGVFTATCLLGGAAAINLQCVCDGLLITITQQAVTYDRGSEQRVVRTGNDPFVTENRRFLEAVRTNNPQLPISTYADALQSHRLCCAAEAAGHG